MTDDPDTPAQSPPAALRADFRNWCEGWKTCLQNVLTQVAGQPAAFELSVEALPVTDSDVWYTVAAAGAIHGEMILHLSADSGTRLAQKLLSETEPAPPGITADHKEALEELLRQVSGLAATALAGAAGGEVKFSLAASAAPTWSSDAIVCLQTRDESGSTIAVEVQISPALATALQAKAQPAATAPAAPPAPASSTDSAPAYAYRRLLDVGLDVKLRFGTRRMLLRDVLALSAGVVVELENALHSPVDLLLDGRIIAQGEVVIVDGKYGLRITDVVDHQPVAKSSA
jgi:flagellar motor switch protein FliN/FliY